MVKYYTHEELQFVEKSLKEGVSINKTAVLVGRHSGPLRLHISRYGGKEGYSADLAWKSRKYNSIGRCRKGGRRRGEYLQRIIKLEDDLESLRSQFDIVLEVLKDLKKG